MTFPTGWGYKQKITIDYTKVGSTLSNFPALITRDHLHDDVVDPSGSANAQSDGGCVRFSSDAAGTSQLACEVVSFAHDTSTGAGDAEIQIWVNVPNVSSSVDTDIYIWYNTAGSDSQPAVTGTYGRNNVWTNNYEAVWHLEEDPSGTSPQAVDSTGNGIDLTSNGTMTSGDLVSSQIGNGWDFDSTDDFADGADVSMTGNTESSFSFWQYRRAASGTARSLSIFYGGSDDIRFYDSSSNIIFTMDDGSTSGQITIGVTNNTWQHIYGTHDGSTQRAYRDGSEIGSGNSKTFNYSSLTGHVELGNGVGSSYFDGILGEVAIHNIARSAGWITSEYNNQSSPSTFASSNTPTAVGGAAANPKGPLGMPFHGPFGGPI